MGFRPARPAIRSSLIRGGLASAIALAGVLASAGTVALPATAGAATSPTTLTTAHNKTWGTILTLSNGTVVYRLTTDPKNKSVCSGACPKIWPPVTLAAGQRKPAGNGLSGLGTITRSDGTHQVTFNGIPLYRYIGDHKAGQATGNLKDKWGRWWVVNPAHPRVAPAAINASTGVTTSPSSGGSTPASGGGSAPTTPPSGGGSAPKSGGGVAPTTAPSSGAAY
jgi:predicted lipoprotein with Yx(FWY)xxD motif